MLKCKTNHMYTSAGIHCWQTSGGKEAANVSKCYMSLKYTQVQTKLFLNIYILQLLLISIIRYLLQADLLLRILITVCAASSAISGGFQEHNQRWCNDPGVHLFIKSSTKFEILIICHALFSFLFSNIISYVNCHVGTFWPNEVKSNFW